MSEAGGDSIQSTSVQQKPVNSRLILLAGFGGLLILMALVGFDAIRALRTIQAGDNKIRQAYLSRNRVLDQIRSDLYLSGTYIRDYLLETEPSRAESHRRRLVKTRSEMDAALGSYEELLAPEERLPFAVLKQEIVTYWNVLDPVFKWDTSQRQSNGYVFLREQVFPRRMAMLSIADQIASINERQLSMGDKEVSAIFSRFRGRLLITLALTLGLGLLLAGFAMSKMLRLETEAAERYREIANARSELKELSARLVEAQENERRAISRELHDEIGQSLSAVLVELRNLSLSAPPGGNSKLDGHLEVIQGLVENCMAVVRNMALLLRPSMLDDFGLVPALQWQAREVSRRTGMRVKVVAEQVSEDLPEDHKTCIYRVVQEALHNCSRHSAARLVRITLRQEPHRLLLSVQDDGRGFESGQERGLGLLGMQERVTHLGGTFHVESQPARGTRVDVTVPLAQTAAVKVQVNS